MKNIPIGVGEPVGVKVGVGVDVAVELAVGVAVAVGVFVGVAVCVLVGVAVCVLVGVGLIGVGVTPATVVVTVWAVLLFSLDSKTLFSGSITTLVPALVSVPRF